MNRARLDRCRKLPFSNEWVLYSVYCWRFGCEVGRESSKLTGLVRSQLQADNATIELHLEDISSPGSFSSYYHLSRNISFRPLTLSPSSFVFNSGESPGSSRSTRLPFLPRLSLRLASLLVDTILFLQRLITECGVSPTKVAELVQELPPKDFANIRESRPRFFLLS